MEQFRIMHPDDNAPTSSSEGPTPPGTILLADDEETVRFVLVKTMEKQGIKVLAAANGREALRLYAENASQIDGILLDITMPDISGMEVLEQLQVAGVAVPIVMMSGYSDSDEALHLHERGVAGFLEKPFRPTEAVARLKDYFKI